MRKYDKSNEQQNCLKNTGFQCLGIIDYEPMKFSMPNGFYRKIESLVYFQTILTIQQQRTEINLNVWYRKSRIKAGVTGAARD